MIIQLKEQSVNLIEVVSKYTTITEELIRRKKRKNLQLLIKILIR